MPSRLTAVRGLLLVNPRSGDDRPSVDDLVRAANDVGVEVHVLVEGDDAAEVARSSGADVLGVAGGDGSLGAVAQVAVERGIPYVCVPFGTRNISPVTRGSTATTRWRLWLHSRAASSGGSTSAGWSRRIERVRVLEQRLARPVRVARSSAGSASPAR